jgi:hypothetical protein
VSDAAVIDRSRVEYQHGRVKVADLVPYARNSRTHSPEQVAQLVAAIKRWGFTNPVLIDEANGLIAGHGRIMAASQMGLDEVPFIRLGGLSDEERRAYVIADNKLALNSGWDDAMLADELRSLAGAGFDLGLTGFSAAEIGGLVGGHQGLTDPDAAPPAPVTPRSKLGDVWLLGAHRLACGDCTDRSSVAAALGNARPHLMVTDPPYGVSYDPSWRLAAGVGSHGAALGQVLNDDRADWREAWALFPGAVAYVWHGGLHAAAVQESLKASGFNLRAQIIWVKTRPALSRGHYHWQHEPAYYGVRDGAEDQWRFVPEHEVVAYAVKDKATASWGGGQEAVHHLVHRAPEERHRARDAETGRVHEAPDRKQQQPRPGHLRALQRQRHHPHRGRDDRPGLPRDRAVARLRGRGGDALARLHRQESRARSHWRVFLGVA